MGYIHVIHFAANGIKKKWKAFQRCWQLAKCARVARHEGRRWARIGVRRRTRIDRAMPSEAGACFN
jgi:hypothetical protein